MENEETMYLFNECLNFLRENKVIFPAITTLEKLVWGARIEAEKNLLILSVILLQKNRRMHLMNY